MASIALTRPPRILFLDAYDSFSQNIIALIQTNIAAEIVVTYIDESSVASGEGEQYHNLFCEFLKDFDAVIAGPGPGWANCDEDVGLMKELWKLQDKDLLPVLGICLGFQSLCLAFGAVIEKLKEPKHGIVTKVLHNDQDIFRNVEQILATQYHSLQANIDHPIQISRAVRYPAQLWEPTQSCPLLQPLAWDFDSEPNGAVLMGVRHTQKPFWGVQFHPESVCTSREAEQVIRNWWESAQAWNRTQISENAASESLSHGNSTSRPVEASQRDFNLNKMEEQLDQNQGPCSLVHDSDTIAPNELASLIAHGDGQTLPDLPPHAVLSVTIGPAKYTVAEVCELLALPRQEAIVLESGLQRDHRPMAVGTGRYSIIGVVIPDETLRLHYYAGSETMQLRDGNDQIHTEWTIANPWPYIEKVMESLRPLKRPQSLSMSPFWGGLMGYASYEAGPQRGGTDANADTPYPDICFAYITRSIVFDHQLGTIYVQSIRGTHDHAWVADMYQKISEATVLKPVPSASSMTTLPDADSLNEGNSMEQYVASCKEGVAIKEAYLEKVRLCKNAISNGQSYELCLTARNGIRAPKSAACQASQAVDNEHSWNLYKRLTSRNPAPFSAYMRMHNIHILSSSPERYISWDRSQIAQCRPIKGTVQKKPGVTAEMAHAILSSSKERAENLMIVDLTRHQLHGVYGAGNVQVSKLMEVEEYETLWQLVSTIDAVPVELRPTEDGLEERADRVRLDKQAIPYLGFKAFVESLPPGSMTGAPKRRSCEILHMVEDGVRRGIYSGVLGYLDVGGGGDFSVMIRTAVKIDTGKDEEEDVWMIGAGGAVTSQSTPEGEYDEMLAKFNSTACAFRHYPPPALEPERKGLEELARENPVFAQLVADMRSTEGLSVDQAQTMLRAVEREIQRRTGGIPEDDGGNME